MTRRLLVTGSRDWWDRDKLYRVLSDVVVTDMASYDPPRPLGDYVLIHGAARGADSLADDWARAKGITVESYPADWEKHGKAAGPIRNQQMLDLGVDICIAFPKANSVGTKHMVKICKAAKVPVTVVL